MMRSVSTWPEEIESKEGTVTLLQGAQLSGPISAGRSHVWLLNLCEELLGA